MTRLVLILLVACERAGGETYAIGWVGPHAGDQTEVISKLTQHGPHVGDHVFFEHGMFEDTTVAGERITGQKVRYLSYQRDGVELPRASYEVVAREGHVDFVTIDGTLTDDEQSQERDALRLTFADPAPRKRLVLRRFHIGESYHLRPDEAEAIGVPGFDASLVLRASHDDTCRFEIDGTTVHDQVTWQAHGTIETYGPNYLHFHQVLELASGDDRITFDHLQRKP